MRVRIESKRIENSNKAQYISSDMKETLDFVFSPIQPIDRIGDSGNLLLAKRKLNHKEQYLVKHAYTDCACNEFIYTKLAQAMGYHMPDAVLFHLSKSEKRRCFTTEYIIGLRYLELINKSPTYHEIRELAKNWKEYFAFQALYYIFGECDGLDTPIASDNFIYRVDTTDAFPVNDCILSAAGINIEINGNNPYLILKKQLLSSNFSTAFSNSYCDFGLECCLKEDEACLPYFLEPFSRIQEISDDYIDDFLNILCYLYPDYIGEYFKLYIAAIQRQACEYLKKKH